MVLVPGILGNINDHYLCTIIEESAQHGYDWMVINYRGVTHQLTTGVPFTSLEYESFKQPLMHIMRTNPGRQIFIAGYSLGGNFVANLVSDPDIDNGQINAAVLANPALDLEQVSITVKKSLFGFYNRRFGSLFKNHMKWSHSIAVLEKDFD